MTTRVLDIDLAHMRRALALARRGQGRVEPNPMVGCVLARGLRIIAEGYHRRFGGVHAEVDALQRAVETTRRATAYVTLEPCCYRGKTPPCTDALIRAGVARVVAAMTDPAELVNGKGLRRLRRSGVAVDVGLLEEKAVELNRPYLKLVRQGRPWVILKWAQSLDGKIASRTGDSEWISSEQSRRSVHRLRARVDAILVGIGTVLADDPMLDARGTPLRRIATRVVLDTRLRLPERCRIVATAGRVPALVLTSPRSLREKARKAAGLERRGVELVPCRTVGGVLDLTAALRLLAGRRFTNVLVEGGSRLLSAFLDRRLADEAMVFVAAKLIGGSGAPTAYAGRGVSRVQDAVRVRTRVRRRGDDLLYHLFLQ
ncbi:MAG: bifunctional diaminohydroxyphosphoribosylaminopyrimidine deaminase/5-amino-6-(5-phosphoribosylamino)uracil reductase RibD [Phycisphaerales bacterium]|nr:MAG: bifunctional diaminohydroxyphosphoribosylaminopyrimidine deaminase/5-amino-6-(5-phosphoribosylamino)uracil reductase RibD [Phycisphaerales bacterium]